LFVGTDLFLWEKGTLRKTLLMRCLHLERSPPQAALMSLTRQRKYRLRPAPSSTGTAGLALVVAWPKKTTLAGVVLDVSLSAVGLAAMGLVP